jgi:hypothetical protein
MRSLFKLTLVVLVALSAWAAACGGTGFDPQSRVDSVRMFAARIDKPYARPGETVNIEVLLTDARRDRPRPLELYWIPIACLNPTADLYYLCFAGAAGAADGGVSPDGGVRFVPAGPLEDGGAGIPGAPPPGAPPTSLPTNIDLAPFLPRGPIFSFTMPEDAIVPRVGTDPYGLAYLFNIACAGQVRFVPPAPGAGAQQIPLQCTDEDGNPLPPTDYVIGFVRVYAYETRTNENPVIESVTYQGEPIDLTAGITLPPCRDVKRRADCPEHEIGVRIPLSSWERNPSETEPLGEQREQIWVTYYSDVGSFADAARLLFDPRRGQIPDPDVVFRAPATAGDGTLWAVVHDNRGGAAWAVIPVRVREDAPLIPPPP